MEAEILELNQKLENNIIMGRCIFHEENNLRKSRALRKQNMDDRIGAGSNEPEYVRR